MNRTRENNCLFCETNKAIVTGSHLIPAALISTMVGPRDQEEVYSLAPSSDQPIGVFMGRSNLKNTNPIPQQNEFVKDYIFCPGCETFFGILESEIIPVIKADIKDDNKRNNFPLTQIHPDVSFYSCLKTDPTIFRLFILSLIWRMDIMYQLKFGKPFLQDSMLDYFKRILLQSKDKNRNEILRKTNVRNLESFPFLILGCFDDHDKTENQTLPHPEFKLPYLFLINELILIFGFNPDDLFKSEIMANAPFKISKDYLNTTGMIKIGKIELEVWSNFNISMLRKVASNFVIRYSSLLSKEKNITLQEAGERLQNLAKQIESQSELDYANAYLEAFNRLMKA